MTTSWLRICRALAIAGVLLLLGGVASADKKTALEHYKKGTTAYNLGKFDQAIGHFEAAYEEHPDPVFLFNIAQCYRQLDNCERSTFFYRRYLSLKPDAANRDEVEARIKELEQQCEEKDELPKRPPEGTVPPGSKGGAGTKPPPPKKDPPPPPPKVEEKKDPPPPPPKVEEKNDPPPTEVAVVDEGGGGDGSAVVDAGTAGSVTATARRAPMLTSLAELGPAFVSMGRIEVPVKMTVRLGVGYPLRLGPLDLEAGALITITPIQYDFESTGTALLSSVLGNVTAAYPITDKIRVRAELGIGALVFSGLGEGNPFTHNAMGTTGALSMFNVRVGVGVDYFFTDKLVASASPFSYAYSPPKERLHEAIDSIQRIDVLFGVGYRF